MASANTLTGLIPVMYTAADKVARERVGFLAACYKHSGIAQVAKDQTIRYPIVGAQAAADYAPTMTLPNPDGQTVNYADMTINKVRTVQFPWSGEEQASVEQSFDEIFSLQLQQAMRTLCNEMENDLFLAAKRNASRAYGSAGTTPFASAGNFTDFSELRRILVDNGAPESDLHLVLNTAAGAKLRGIQSSLFKVNEAGDGGSLLRDGNLGQIQGFMLHESGQIVQHVKGTGTSYVFNGAHAVGATSVVAKTGTGTVLYGDVVAFEDDANNKYVVNTGIAAAGTMVIGGPGLKQAQTDGKTITVGNSYTGNWAFDRYALHLLTRLPILPKGGDAAVDMYELTDPYSGITFRISLYAGRGMNAVTVDVAWGVKAVKSDFIATLLG